MSRGLRLPGAALSSLLLLAACSSSDTQEPAPDALTKDSPTFQDESKAFQSLKQDADAAGALDAAGARAKYGTRFRQGLSYDPLASENLERIQASALKLSDAEKGVLGETGFVISKRHGFATFLRGLAEIYFEHLPLYVSADALLESVHRSYDDILQDLERDALIPNLHALLDGMRGRLQGLPASQEGRANADLYLAVALSLLDGEPAAPVAGADASLVQSIVSAANRASGVVPFELFGAPREDDFSQFKPRGHYDDGGVLARYFRAMMWLGRVDLRLIETSSDGTQVFHRDQFEVTLLLHRLVLEDATLWQGIDDVVRTFVGESDYMVVPQVASLIADLGGEAAALAASDEAVVNAIVAGGYGKQQIASHLMVNGGTVKTLPLNRSFALFGQRYIVDSHVFSEAVYDRIGGRMMPDPLDAAFAALGNNQALALDPDVSTVPELPGALTRMRVLVDSHPTSFWEANFYNLWLASLRALSPAADLSDPGASGLPEIAGTEAWGRRLLNAQLGSWAELRHDTVLYAKQSYSGIPGCAFPDVYVDPYPDVYAAIQKYAENGSRIVSLASGANASLGSRVASYFDELRNAATILRGMAEKQRAGTAFSSDELAFINEAVRVVSEDAVCTTVEHPDGWYAKLFYRPEASIEALPTIADVHTQPADEDGDIVGRVLHVATGYPRLMVTTVDTCNGPRAYAGVVYAYHEKVTEAFERLTDEEWRNELAAGPAPADVPWLTDVIAE